MILLIEGPDGSGKTVLADAMLSYAASAGTPAAVRHTGAPDPPKRCPFTEYEALFDAGGPAAETAWDPGRLLILDRHHTGEQVYGPVFRGSSRLTDNGMYHIELALEALGCVKLVILPPADVLWHQLLSRPDHSSFDKYFHDPVKLAEVREWYFQYAISNHYRIISDSHVSLGRLMIDLDFKSQLAEPVRALTSGTYLGSLQPSALICGDARGAGRLARPDLIRPFTPTTKGSGSNYLLTALRDSRLRHGCGIVNANDSSVDIRELAKCGILGGPAVVALGESASATLRRQGIRHRKVPHPSWASRFRHGCEAWYAGEIESAVKEQE